MTARLVYRSYGGENMKSRPAYYSKLLALASFVRAAEAAPVDVTFLNDGPIPDDRLAMMHGRGNVIDIAGGPLGMRSSYIKGLELATELDWPDHDLVYYCEDDYLHTVDAFASLVTAAEQLPEATYFTLHGAKERHPELDYPRHWRPRPDVTAGNRTWTNIPSTTSTFGGRVGAVKEDMAIFKQCMRPFTRTFLDHETCLLYQGYRPYNVREVLIGPPDRRATDPRSIAKNCVLVPFRIGMNVRAVTRRHRPHLLYSAEPNVACHLENEHMAPGVDWTAVASETRAWAADAGHPVNTHGAA